MKKLFLVIGAVLLLVASLAACRPIIGTPYTVTASLSEFSLGSWQAQTGPTYGSSNLNADYATIAASPSTYGYTVVTGKVSVTSTSNNNLNHAIVKGCIQVEPGASSVYIYDVFVVGGYGGVWCNGPVGAGTEDTAIQVPENQVLNAQFIDIEVFPDSSVTTPWTKHGIIGGDFSCGRCDVHGFGKGIWASGDALIQDSMSYDVKGEPFTYQSCHPDEDHIDPPCRHVDAMFVQGSTNVQVKHSWIDGSVDGTTCCTTGGFTAGSTVNWLLTDSFIMAGNGPNGGGGGLAMDNGSGASTNLVVTNNVFSDHQWVSYFLPSGSTYTWTGNTFETLGACTYGVSPCTV